MILELLSPEQRLEAVNERDIYGESLLYKAVMKPELFKIILELFPPEQRLEALKVKNSYGNSPLFSAIQNPELFKIILELYPPEQRFEAVNVKNRYGQSLLSKSIVKPELFKIILELLPPEQRLEAVKEKNRAGDSLLFKAISKPESLKMILELYPPEQRLEAVKEKPKYDDSLLFKAVNNPETFKIILELLTPEQRLEALNEEHVQGQTYLKRIYTYYPETFQVFLNALPEEVALVFKEREKDLGSNSNEVFACAFSIEQFMKDMQELAPPEFIKSFVQALIKNENIVSAKEDLFKATSSPSFFKSNNLEAIQQCIDKLHPYWLTRTQPSQPEPIQPKI